MLDRRVRQAFRIGQSAPTVTAEALGEYAERLARVDSPLVPLVRRAEGRAQAFALLPASPHS